MDFFKDFSDLSNTPVYSKYDKQYPQRNTNNRLQQSINKGRKDDFDDLLDNLMNKQQLRKSRKNIEPYSSKNIEPYSSKNIEPYSSKNIAVYGFDSLAKTTQKFQNQNTQSELNFTHGVSKGGKNVYKKSILDDLMSQDNKSNKSVATGRRNNPDLNKDNDPLINNITLPPNLLGRGGMRPPLKKKGQSEEPSIHIQQRSLNRFNDNTGSIDDLDLNTPRVPKRSTTMRTNLYMQQQSEKMVRFQLSDSKQKQKSLFKSIPETTLKQIQRPIVHQKIVNVKQDSKQLTQRYQQQIKSIKESYERQISAIKHNYQKVIEEERRIRRDVANNYQNAVDNQKKKWEKIIQEQLERVKQLYGWENKKKSQGYQLEVNKLKQLIQTVTRTQKNQNSQNSQETSFQFTQKFKQLQKQRERLENQLSVMQAKRRQFQSQEHQFQIYRRKQENKLNQEKKKIFQYETQVRRRQVEIKKQHMTEKQSLAAEMVNSQLTFAQARESIKYQKDKLSMQRQLFTQQKQQYDRINNKILSDLKQRQRQVESQKQQVNSLQIDLYKKLNTMQMMSVQKGLSSNKNNNTSLNLTMVRNANRSETQNRSISFYQQKHKQNYRNRVNSQLDNKIADTKSRYAQMQQVVRDNSVRRQSNNGGTKIHLQKYIDKLTKDRLKVQKF